MSDADEMPKLSMAPRETLEDSIQRIEREKRQERNKRESRLEEAATEFRIGSVPYLNSVPLTRGIEHNTKFLPPSQLAESLRKGELDAALVSVTEALLHDCYDILDGVNVAALGEVASVFVAHRKPLEEASEIWCDTASLSSVNLLKVLLAERGLTPELKQLDNYDNAGEHDFVMLIGNPAIDFVRSEPEHEIWDLGAAWYELTNLPFVFAVWALRRDVENRAKLCAELRDAKDFGMDTLDFIISDRDEYDRDFRQDYLGWHIHYHLGEDEKRGLAKFADLLEKHGLGPVFRPTFVAQ